MLHSLNHLNILTTFIPKASEKNVPVIKRGSIFINTYKLVPTLYQLVTLITLAY